ncbi:hypothetical protein SAMN05444377_1082 [Flavobacterium fontis]|uniref:Uncharacterized protein n=1 Tax=Flavobacterium fontis TaxID=1124188 RepID=A0A1M5BAW9_9FLAO|nr:hypothetical protein [Flavobacterium fontis]SHF39536.1 hypothetical protein SAMN05444377_1082 [Flavobacterium fontis]
MKLIHKTFWVLGLLLFFNGCNQFEKKQAAIFLEVYFLDPGLKFPMNISCQALRSEMLKERVKYKLIDNEDTLKLFQRYYNQLKNDTTQINFDVKMQVIYHNHAQVDSLCMGSNFNITVNGVKKKESKDFHNFIRSNVYGAH